MGFTQTKQGGVMTKIISWVLLNGATLLGCLQAVVKAIKELLTGVVNLVSIFLPSFASKKVVETVRNVMNQIDDFIEKIKTNFIK